MDNRWTAFEPVSGLRPALQLRMRPSPTTSSYCMRQAYTYVPAMEDPRGSVRAAGPQPRPGGGLSHPAAARRVSPDAFLRGASIAWAHLQPEERKAVRATCRDGRQLHDRLTTHLRIKLVYHKVQKRKAARGQQHGQQNQAPLLSRPGLRTSLGAMVARGARLQSLTVWFTGGLNDGRQAQL